MKTWHRDGVPLRALLAFWAIAILSLAIAVLATVADRGPEARALDEALTLPLENFDGTETSLASFVGQPMIVSFFSSECFTCLIDLPELEQIHQQMGADVKVIGLNVLEPAEYGLTVIEETGITFEVARDPDGAVFRAFGAFYTPATVLIDSDGRIVEMLSGAVRAEALAERVGALSV